MKKKLYILLILTAFGFDVSFATESYFSCDWHSIESEFNGGSYGLNNVAGFKFTEIADNDILLATLSFSALAGGADMLNIFDPYDRIFSGLFYELSGFSIDSSLDVSVENTAVPEPASIFLFGISLVGIAGYKKKLILRNTYDDKNQSLLELKESRFCSEKATNK